MFLLDTVLPHTVFPGFSLLQCKIQKNAGSSPDQAVQDNTLPM